MLSLCCIGMVIFAPEMSIIHEEMNARIYEERIDVPDSFLRLKTQQKFKTRSVGQLLSFEPLTFMF